jgi:hypothetical protein
MDLKLKLESVQVHDTDDGFLGGSSEWRMDFFTGSKFFEFNKDGVDPGDFFNVGKTVDITMSPTQDLNITSKGVEDDISFDDNLPVAKLTLHSQDYFDHTFSMFAQNDDYSYTTTWQLDVV